MQKNRLSELLGWRRVEETNIRYLGVLNQRRQMSSVAEKRKKIIVLKFYSRITSISTLRKGESQSGVHGRKISFLPSLELESLLWNWNPYSAFLYDSTHTAG